MTLTERAAVAAARAERRSVLQELADARATLDAAHADYLSRAAHMRTLIAAAKADGPSIGIQVKDIAQATGYSISRVSHITADTTARR